MDPTIVVIILISDVKCGLLTVPVQSVHLLSRDSAGTHVHMYEEAERVTFSDGEIRQIVCRINGSSPAPQARVYVGDQDITDHFTQTTQRISVGPAVTKGLQVREQYQYFTLAL